MPKNKIKEIPQFEMPSNFIEQIYELSGNADKYKGVLLAYVSEDGSPVIYCKYDSQVVEFGMRKALEKYLQNSDDAESAYNIAETEEGDEDDLDED
jgi:hypothetical protein